MKLHCKKSWQASCRDGWRSCYSQTYKLSLRKILPGMRVDGGYRNQANQAPQRPCLELLPLKTPGSTSTCLKTSLASFPLDSSVIQMCSNNFWRHQFLWSARSTLLDRSVAIDLMLHIRKRGMRIIAHVYRDSKSAFRSELLDKTCWKPLLRPPTKKQIAF